VTNLDSLTPENARVECRREYLSDSGQYKVVVTPFTTKEGYGHTQGLVFKLGSDTPIAEVRRNYSSFQYTFIENHPNGHHYFIGGEDYQGQTVIELDTGNRRDYLPEEADQGWGFCWVDYQFDVQSGILVVDGCIWAAPFEHRFYDFSDPMQGWPSLDFEGVWAEGKWPEITSDGLVRCYELEPEAEDADENAPTEQRGCASIRTYRRHGNELRFVSVWVSEAEGERRRKRAEGNRKHEAWRKEFKATDALYLEFKQLLKDPSLSPEDSEGIGITYKGWCPDFNVEESRWCRRIIKAKRYTVDLDWGVNTGPVKLTIFRNGKTHDSKFFEHSAEGMREAFAYAKSLITPPVLTSFARPWRAE